MTRPIARVADAVGRCGCCSTAYGVGATLALEHGKWVLTSHDKPAAPASSRRPRGDYYDPAAVRRLT